MKSLPANTIVRHPPQSGLYRFVYLSYLSVLLTLVLVCSFFLQTVDQAFAMETEAVPTSLEPLITDDLLDRVEASALPVAVADAPPVAALEPGTDAPIETTADPGGDSSSSSATSSAETNTVSPPPPPEPAPDDTVITDSSLSSTTSVTATGTESLLAATGTTDIEPQPTLTVFSDAMLQFSKDNCVVVADGSYYCQTATTTNHTDDGLFALPDADGDLEIYLKKAGELTQLTFNTVDDASPQYDPASDSIVWHRFIDDRYQIVVYDVANQSEQQLTDTTTNNMEPFRADNIIVWQHWAHSAWQIMLYDGDTITALTDTLDHNLAPSVRNGLVVWHRVTNGEKTIEVYDISSGSYVTIEDDEGGSIGNPRMVLVYDSTLESGEVVTRGFDLETGEQTSFTSAPERLPEELPDPETMTEERALVGGKSSKDEVSEETRLTGDEPTVLPPMAEEATTTAATSPELPPLTLDLRSDQAEMTTDIVSTSTATGIPDLIVLPLATSTLPLE